MQCIPEIIGNHLFMLMFKGRIRSTPGQLPHPGKHIGQITMRAPY